MIFLLLVFMIVGSAAHADEVTWWSTPSARAEMSGTSAATKPTTGRKAGDTFYELDTLSLYRWTGEAAGDSSNWKRLPVPVTDDTRHAGERNEDSKSGTDYVSTSAECKPSGEIDLSSGSGTIYAGPAIVQWVQVSTTPGTAASSIDDASTAKIPLPVSYPVNVYQFAGTIFCTSLKYTTGASGTGKFNVCYRPLDSTQVTWACP